MTVDEPDWLSVLRALDPPVERGGWVGREVPRHFDRAATQARFDQLAERLSTAYDCPLHAGRGPVQDSSCFGGITVPAEATRTRTKRTRIPLPLSVEVSNFGNLATYGPAYAGANPGTSVPIHPDDRARIEPALTGLEYLIVPQHILATRYDGPNMSNDDTWYVRFFSWL
jgi:hypothetical protein